MTRAEFSLIPNPGSKLCANMGVCPESQSKEKVWTEVINLHQAQRKVTGSSSLINDQGEVALAALCVFCPVLFLPWVTVIAFKAVSSDVFSSSLRVDSIF